MDWRLGAAALLAGILGRLPALGAYWQGQEWAALGRAAGVLGGAEPPPWALSRALLWPAGWALFGLEPDPWSWLRLGLHGACAALTVAVGQRAGLGPGGRLAAGLIVAASPAAFHPLYRAGGLEILLVSALALAATERWLAGGTAARAAAVLLGLLAALSGPWTAGGWQGAWLDLAYPATAAASLAIAALLPPWRPRPVAIVALAVAAGGIGWGGMAWRLAARDGAGLPRDPLVRATAISFAAARALRSAPALGGGDRLLLVSPPRTAAQVESAAQLGRWVPDTETYRALGGPAGPRLLLPPEIQSSWSGDLLRAPVDAFVLADAGHRLVPWGRVPQALLHLALDEVGRGQFRLAKRHLLRGALLSGRVLPFASGAGMLTEPAAEIRRRAPDFIAYLEDPRGAGATDREAAGLRSILEGLLAALPADPAP